MGDLLRAIDAIRQAVDLGANIGWFVAHNVQIVSEALHAFIFRTANPPQSVRGSRLRVNAGRYDIDFERAARSVTGLFCSPT